MQKRLLYTLLVAVCFAVSGVVSADRAAPTVTYLVNSNNDVDDGLCNSTHCSLREAIDAANDTSDADAIHFDFTSPTTLFPEDALPIITQPLHINGIEGTGSSCPTSATTPANLNITLSGLFAGATADGLVFESASDNSSVTGMNIVSFGGTGITAGIASGNNRIICNHIGYDNSSAAGNENGIGILAAGDSTQIGGANVKERNVIIGTSVAVRISSFSDASSVENNYIGTNLTGDGVVGSGSFGITIGSDGHTIGGATEAEGNVIGGFSEGIRIVAGDDNIITNNHIGSDRSGSIPLPNGAGVTLAIARDNVVGGTAGRGNTIAFNTDDGIRVSDDSLRNNLRFNAIYSNGELGIELGPNGITPNDIDDVDVGANWLQNFPVVFSAENSGRISGAYPRGASPTFAHTLDIYTNPACDDQLVGSLPYGEGKTWHASITIPASSISVVNFDELIAPLPTGHFVTMMATDEEGNSSEFGNCKAIAQTNFVVNSTSTLGDANLGDGICATSQGNCTLPAALGQANALGSGGPYEITFDLGSGISNIYPTTPLVASVPLTINGSSNAGAGCPTEILSATPTVQLLGTSLPAGSNLLTLGAGSDGSDIRGLAIIDAPLDGIHVLSSDNVIRCNHIGIQTDGVTVKGNGDDGVELAGGTNNDVGSGSILSYASRNVIAGNGGAGVQVSGAAQGNTIAGNYIGTDSSGTLAKANREGVFILGGSTETTVGGDLDLQRNVISGNTNKGVLIVGSSDQTTIENNYIGVDKTGSSALGNGGAGIKIEASDGTQIGGDSATRNVISGNHDMGIVMLSGAEETMIVANYVGLDAAGIYGLGNTGLGVSATDSAETRLFNNYISANTSHGIWLDNSDDSYLSGNVVGLDKNQNSNNPLGNGDDGIRIASSSSVDSVGNSVAANGRHGVYISDSSDISLESNTIGSANPQAANSNDGVRLLRTDGVTIGGAVGDRNVIIGNLGSGIYANVDVTNLSIMRNYIGRTTTGSPEGNSLDGIHLDNTVSGAQIENNSILYNGRNGIQVGPSSSGNVLLGNTMSSNGGIGIDLGGDGVTFNDKPDTDSGANGLQNFPVIDAAHAGTNVIDGHLNSRASTDYILEFWGNVTCDGSDYGEGRLIRGALTVTTDATGLATFSFVSPSDIGAGEEIVATATDENGDGTSEFSKCEAASDATVTAITLRRNSAESAATKLHILWGGLLFVTLVGCGFGRNRTEPVHH